MCAFSIQHRPLSVFQMRMQGRVAVHFNSWHLDTPTKQVIAIFSNWKSQDWVISIQECVSFSHPHELTCFFFFVHYPLNKIYRKLSVLGHEN